jgi:hypothetical protein
MARFHEVASCLLSSLGVALLIFSLLLVPSSMILATEGGTCPGASCDSGCANRMVNSCASAFLTLCDNGSSGNCTYCGCSDNAGSTACVCQ